jgi:hypothetical protein
VSSPRKTVVPAIPAVTNANPKEVTQALTALKEATEVGFGRRGDPLDRFVTVRDLKEGGLARVNIASGVAALAPPDDGGSGGGDDGADLFDPGDPDFGQNDYTPPPAPTNVQVHHIAPSGLMVTWNPPDYSNHAYAEVFRKPEAGRTLQGDPIPPTFNLGLLPNPNKPVGPDNMHPDFAGRADGTIFTDADLARLDAAGVDPLGEALEPTTYYYWVRFVSTAQVPGPYAPVNGASGQLSIDPALVLGLLITNVTNTPLYRELVGQYFNTNSFDPIMQAGGVTNYIASLDNVLHGEINQQLIRIIGVSDVNPGTPTLIQRLSNVEGIAAADHANLLELNAWQAALTQAAARTDTLSTIIVSYFRDSQFAYFSVGTDVSGQLSQGDTFTITGTGQLAPANGHTVTVDHIQSGNLIFVAITPDNNGFLPLLPTAIFNCGSIAWSTPGAGFIDFVASVYDNIWVSVDPETVLGQRLQTIDGHIADLIANVQQLVSVQANIDGTLEAMWSVQMREVTQSGLVYAAGFGLGLSTELNEDGTFSTTSTFLVNANQFAVMGTGAGGAIITDFVSSGANATVTLQTANHGIRVGDDPNHPNTVVFAITDTFGQENLNPLAALGIAGMECQVVSVSGANVTVHRTDNGSFSGVYHGLAPYKNALMPAPSIPFIIDTTHNVVGIRGKLVVDGLVRATEADFDVLTAQTAFIQQLQAEVVNANVVIAQRLIAGAAGSGAITPGQYQAISNYIIELNNPVTSNFPLRYWKPSNPDPTTNTAFAVDRLGNLFVGGNLSVGGDGVIATDGTNVTSIGGDGAPGSGRFAMWIGPRANYGTHGEGRTEANGAFWVRDDAQRAGFNGDLFLGDSGLILPVLTGPNTQGANLVGVGGENPRADSIVQTVVSSQRINVKPSRSGGPSKVLVIVSGTVATQSTGGNDHKGYLFKATLAGSNASLGYDDTSGALIQETVVDDFAPECWPFTLMGVVTVPAGQYWVRLNMKTTAQAPFSIIKNWNVLAMHVV